nr:MAG TPA: hypothetical protein [Caudoviricetes sp.]
MSQSGTSWVTSAVSGQSLTSMPGSVSPVSVVFLLSVMFYSDQKNGGDAAIRGVMAASVESQRQVTTSPG